MKIVLVAINGSYSHTSLAIRCLRKPLEEAGFEVVLFEKNLRDRPSFVLQDLVKVAHGASLVGFSTYIWNAEMMYDLASNFHKVKPDIKIVFGGPEVSYDTERFDNNPFMDCMIQGEGEEHIVSLANAIAKGEIFPRVYKTQTPKNLMKDEGILYREGDYPAGSIVYYESSRGCPYSCSYCLSSCQEGVRYKTVEQTLKDLKEFEKLPENIKIIKYVDRTFNFPIKRANEIWRALLGDEFTKNYHFEVCANLLNEESFEILQQFPKGKIQLEFGLQSTNEKTLDTVSRHLNAKEILQNVKRIHDFGNIHVHLDLIAGLPYESYERFKESFDEAYPVCDLLQVGFLKLLRGTTLRQKEKEYGFVFEDKPPYTIIQNNWINYEELSQLSKLAEILERYFESGKFESCLRFILKKVPSPFDFYVGLVKKVDETGNHIQQLSQLDAYRILYEYANDLLNEKDLEQFSSLMHEDYTRKEVRKVPSFLKNDNKDI